MSLQKRPDDESLAHLQDLIAGSDSTGLAHRSSCDFGGIAKYCAWRGYQCPVSVRVRVRVRVTTMFAPKVAKPQAKTLSQPDDLARRPRRSPAQRALAGRRAIGNQAMLRRPSQGPAALTGNERSNQQQRERAAAAAQAPAALRDFRSVPTSAADRPGQASWQPLLSLRPSLAAGMNAVTEEAIHQATVENGAAALPSHAAFSVAAARARMRDDARADRSARLLGAEAVAFGDQILFRSGRYAPSTEPGRALIAHELAHVAHQGQSGRRHPQRSVATDVPSVHFTQAMAEAMADTELDQQMQLLGAHLAVEPGDVGAAENLAVLEEVAKGWPGMVVQASPPAAAAPTAPAQPGNVPPAQVPQVTAPSQQILYPDVEDAPKRPGAVAPDLLLGFDPLVPDPEPTEFEQKLRSNQPFALRMMPQPDVDPRQAQWLGHQPTAAELAHMRPEAAGELPSSTSIFVPRYSFEVTVSGTEAMPIRDPKTHALLGYRIRQGATVYRVDRNGILMGSQGTEKPLERPLVDPIDVALLAVDVGPLVAKGIVAGGKALGRAAFEGATDAALKGATREASEFESKLMAREATASLEQGAVETLYGQLTPPTHQLPPHIETPRVADFAKNVGSHGERVVEREVLENFLPGAEQFSAKAAGFDAAEGVRVVSATTSRASDGVTTVIEKRITGGNWYQIKGISEPRSDLVFNNVNDAMERAANGLRMAMQNKFERVAPGFAYRTAYAGRPDRITIFLKLDKGSVTKDLVDAAEKAVNSSVHLSDLPPVRVVIVGR